MVEIGSAAPAVHVPTSTRASPKYPKLTPRVLKAIAWEHQRIRAMYKPNIEASEANVEEGLEPQPVVGDKIWVIDEFIEGCQNAEYENSMEE